MRGHEFVQDGGQLVQAVQVRPGELLQDLFAAGRQPDPHDPAVAGVRYPLHLAGGCARSTSSTALCGRNSR